MNQASSIADTTALESLIAKAKEAQQKATEASDIIVQAESAAKAASADDGSLSPADLVDRRDNARRELEIAKVEYDRIQKSAEDLLSQAEALAQQLVKPVSTALFDSGDRSREQSLAELSKNFEDEGDWIAYRTRYDIRSFVSEFDRVRLPLGLWKRVKDFDFRRFSAAPGPVLSRLETFVGLMVEARRFV